MRINPVALVFWALCALAGHLIGGITGAEIGLVIGIVLSLVGQFV